MIKTDDLALFLTEKTGSCLGLWAGKLSKAEQLNIIGAYLGKGTIIINGTEETVTHSIKVCYGTDTAWTAQYKFDGTKVI